MKKQIFNPYLPGFEYVPDAEPRVFGDRLYIYGSHDRFDGNDFCLNDYVCWSAPLDDLSNWNYEGIIYRALQDPANTKGKMHMCAPDCIRGKDGRYYLYYQLHVLSYTCVAVSDNPAGPFEYYGTVQHPDGAPWGTKKGDAFAFDPGVLVDDDGRIWLYVGFAPQGLLKKSFEMRGNMVKHSVVLELEDDMKTVKGGEYPIIPGPEEAVRTPYEGHSFFEASSIRKIGSLYYLVYSSELSHELCYATSTIPNGGFAYGGTLVSIGDVGFRGNTRAVNYTGNTHGGMAEINGQWYIFYHRQTNRQKCARQGCAEKIYLAEDGSIGQVEMTSCGLNKGPLSGKGSYPAAIACNLSSRTGTDAYTATRQKDPKKQHPYITQKQPDGMLENTQYIANMKSYSWAGYKYFAFDGSEKTITLEAECTGSGCIVVSGSRFSNRYARIPVSGTGTLACYQAAFHPEIGTRALYFTYSGTGSINLYRFQIE